MNDRALRTPRSFQAHPQLSRTEIGDDGPLRGKLAIAGHPHLQLQKSELPAANRGPSSVPSRVFSSDARDP